MTSTRYRQIYNIVCLYIALLSLSAQFYSLTAFAPVAPTSTTSPCSTPLPPPPRLLLFLHRSSSRMSPPYVTVLLPPLPSPHISTFQGSKNLLLRKYNNIHARNSLTLRAAVIQAYRLENDFSHHHSDPPHPTSSASVSVSQPKLQSDVFSFLPTRLSSVQRMDSPSQFQSQVLDEKNSLVVVRFYADACPSCRATGPLFRRWSREMESSSLASMEDRTNCQLSNASSSSQVHSDPLSIKFLEMPLNKATSRFLQDQLRVDRLPTCRLYHPKLGLVEEQLVKTNGELRDFVRVVDDWSKKGCDANWGGHPSGDYNSSRVNGENNEKGRGFQ